MHQEYEDKSYNHLQTQIVQITRQTTAALDPQDINLPYIASFMRSNRNPRELKEGLTEEGPARVFVNLVANFSGTSFQIMEDEIRGILRNAAPQQRALFAVGLKKDGEPPKGFKKTRLTKEGKGQILGLLKGPLGTLWRSTSMQHQTEFLDRVCKAAEEEKSIQLQAKSHLARQREDRKPMYSALVQKVHEEKRLSMLSATEAQLENSAKGSVRSCQKQIFKSVLPDNASAVEAYLEYRQLDADIGPDELKKIKKDTSRDSIVNKLSR